jgi:hypothetical protein
LNASLYEHRALPPLPPPLSALPALQKCSSVESLYSAPSRPGTAMTDRQSYDKSLPPLPLCTSPSCKDSKPCEVERTQPKRPRSKRSISFRGLIDRYSSSSSSTEDVPSLKSSVSSNGTRDSRADSVVGDYVLAQVTNNAPVGSSAPGSRRPSLSLTQLRASSKKHYTVPPPMPIRPVAYHKASASQGGSHRWNPFGRNADDKDDIPPVPSTPPFVQELSFTQCYYFSARHCNGYVLSNGANGDACENCARSGFLGSP